MDETIRLPLSLLFSAFTGLAGFVAAWVTFRTRLTALERGHAKLDTRLEKIEEKAEKQKDDLRDAHNDIQAAARRISDIAELKETTVTRELFALRMNNQDDVLNELRISMDRKVSVSAMPATAASTDPRVDPRVDRAPLPPMRPRLPSRPR